MTSDDWMGWFSFELGLQHHLLLLYLTLHPLITPLAQPVLQLMLARIDLHLHWSRDPAGVLMAHLSRPIVVSRRLQPILQRTSPFGAVTGIHFFLQLGQTDAIPFGFSLPTFLLRFDLGVFVLELKVADCEIITKYIWSVNFVCTVDYVIGHHLTLTFFSLLGTNRNQLEVHIWVLLAAANAETLMPLSGETDAVVDLGWVSAVLEDDHEFFGVSFVACVEDGFEVGESQVIAVVLHSVSYFAVDGVVGDIGFEWLRVRGRDWLFDDGLYS